MGLLDLILDRGNGTLTAEQVRAARGQTVTVISEGAERNRYAGSATNSAVAHRCVQAIAGNLAALDLTVLTGEGEALNDDPIARLFNRAPNPAWSARTFKEVLWARMEYQGEAFVYIDRGPSGTGDPLELWPIFDEVVPIVDALPYQQTGDTESPDVLVGFQVRLSNGRRVGLLPSEVLWLRYPDPTTPWGALAPWKRAAFAAELDEWMRSWQLGELRNGMRPANVVYLGDLDEDQHKQTVAEYRAATDGPANANKSLFVSSPQAARVERMGLTPAEISYLESRRFNAEEMMLAFGVPKDYLVGGSTFDNQRAAKVNLWTDTLVSKLEVVASEADRQLVPDEGRSCAFDVSEVDALNENLDSISARLVAQVAADVLLLDEAREQLGMDPMPEGLGQQTLTAYRAQVGAGAATPLPATGELAARIGRSPLAPCRPRLFVTRTGFRAIAPRRGPHAVAGFHTRARKPSSLTPAQVLRLYDRHEARGRRVVAQLAAKQERVVLRALRQAARRTASRVGAEPGQLLAEHLRINPDDIYDAAYWRVVTQDALEPFVASVWDEGGQRTAAALSLNFDLFDTAVTAAMRHRLAVLSGQVTDTTRQVLADDVLAPGVAAGESVDVLAERIRERFADLSGWRAECIARTETVGGFNAASRQAATRSGLVRARKWVATHDGRVRETHSELDGYETRGLDDAYPNGCMHPGDPSGPAAETINCRCVETYLLTED